MTKDEQHSKEQAANEVLSVLDGVHEAVAAVTEARMKLCELLKPSIREEERLALFHLDMTIAQLDMLAVDVAMRAQK